MTSDGTPAASTGDPIGVRTNPLQLLRKERPPPGSALDLDAT